MATIEMRVSHLRLNAIQIEGFGGVAGQVKVPLDADVIVVAGSNGHGKTTICNAISWVLTGKHPSDADPRNAYSRSGSTSVALTIGDNASSIKTIRRTLVNPDVLDPRKNEWSLVIQDGESILSGSRAEDWLKVNVANADSRDDFQSAMHTAVESIYMKQESLRDFLVERSDVERFSSISQMVGAGKLTSFVSQFESEKNAWVRSTNKSSNYLQQQRDQLLELLQARTSLREEVAQARTSEVSDRWKKWWMRAMEATGNPLTSAPDLSEASLDATLSAIASRQRELRHQEGELRNLAAEFSVPLPDSPSTRTIALNTTELRKLEELQLHAEQKLQQIQLQLNEIQIEVSQRKSFRDDLSALAQIALRHVGESCPTCGQSVDPVALEGRLRQYLESSNSAVETVALGKTLEALEACETTLRATREKKHRMQRLVLLDQEKQAASQSARSRRMERAAELGVTVSRDADDEALTAHVLQQINSENSMLLQRRSELDDIEQMAQSFEPAVALIKSQRRMTRLDLEVAEAEGQLHQAERELVARQQIGSRADALLKVLKRDSESFVGSRISSLQPILDQFYAAIDPHPTFRSVQMATRMFNGKHRLNPVVRDEELSLTIDDPGKTLSTSQANALAVALFMSFNMGFSSSAIESMILDDPLQNLDDIHLLGLVDLLRKVAPHRQLLVTTHDQAFASLLCRKLRPVREGSKTLLVRFNGWDRSGPDIDAIEVPTEGQPLKIAKAV